MPRPRQYVSASAARAHEAIQKAKRDAERAAAAAARADTLVIPHEHGLAYTCITCHPEETDRLLPMLARRRPPPNPKGLYICHWCGTRTSNPRLGFHTFVKSGECVCEALCPWCANSLMSGRGLDPAALPECHWPVAMRRTLAEIGAPVYRIRGVLVWVPRQFDTYKKKPTPKVSKKP